MERDYNEWRRNSKTYHVKHNSFFGEFKTAMDIGLIKKNGGRNESV